MPELIPLADFAAANNLTYNQAFNLALSGKIPARKLGGRWFIVLKESPVVA